MICLCLTGKVRMKRCNRISHRSLLVTFGRVVAACLFSHHSLQVLYGSNAHGGRWSHFICGCCGKGALEDTLQ